MDMDIASFRQRARVRAERGIEVVWGEYLAWLGATFPRIAASLRAPDPSAARGLEELEKIVGVAMPGQLRALYRLTGGEARFAGEGVGSGALFGVSLMPVGEVMDYYRRPWDWGGGWGAAGV